MNDTQIGAIAESGELYTVKLYAGTTLKATYTEKLLKRPVLNSYLTVSGFPSFSAASVALFSSFKGGDLPVSWTLPAGLTNSGVHCNIYDDAGNSATIEHTPLPADRSKTVTLAAKAGTGQSFTPTHRWLDLSAADMFGRKFEAVTH